MTSRIKKNCSVLLLLAALVFIQCGDGLPDDPYANIPSALAVDLSTGYSSLDVSMARTNVFNFPFETLSNQEEKGLKFAREEEKVALDYYTWILTLFSSEELTQLAQSELTHFNVSGLLIDKYNLTDPTEGMALGTFKSQSLQAHYDQLVTEGSPSLQAAYIAGAKMQEANLVTIQNQLDRVANNRDLRHVYSALRIATRNHLRVMVNGVAANGGTYNPQFIDAADFQEILSSGFEGGA